MMTITHRNLSSIPAMLDLLAEHEVDTFATERFIPEGAGAELKDVALAPEEAREAFETVHALGIREKRLRVLMYRPLFALIDREDPSVGAMCSIGVNALTIMHDGTVYPCRRLPISLGNILEDGLFKIWYDSDLLWRIRTSSNIKQCAECDLVPVCRGCRAMAYFSSGDFCGPDPHCWKDQECTV
jgi:radical SAM protein with 4Fe4S-binding SPASM domain